MADLHKDLFDDNHIDREQFDFLEAVNQRKIISVYYELRLLLYLGIMLFTGGVGYLVYENMGNTLHILLMSSIGVSIVFGSYYINLKSSAYSNHKVDVVHPYFDYIVILTSLLIISLFTYIQVYFELVELLVNWASITTAVLFLYAAYQYDNKMVLSMGVTALAAALGLSISPLGWVSGLSLHEESLYTLSILLGIVLLIVGRMSTLKSIKPHFSFSYENFGLLLLYFGLLALVFDSSMEVLMAVITLFISGAIGWYVWKEKLFLFFLFSVITGYITFTYLIISLGIDEFLLIYYFPISSIGAVVLLIKYRSHFSND